MISVEAARRRILAAAVPLPAEIVGLSDGLGRVLAEPLAARLTQPRAALSAMDGYAVRAADVARVPATVTEIAAVPAGAAFGGSVRPGECVRIFTGAPVPDGADTIAIQETATRDGTRITVHQAVTAGRHIRPAGADFSAGQVLLEAGRVLSARDLALAAAMDRPWLSVRRRPRVAILATGNELVRPGEPLGPNQTIASAGFGVAAQVIAEGGVPVDLGIARDEAEALARLADRAAGTDLLITIGGASVGEHDLVRSALGGRGLDLDFWTIAMRPGKPLMFGRIGAVPMLGLPGNPVSALVCAVLFARPMLRAMLGVQPESDPPPSARLGRDLPANDRRQDYLRSILSASAEGLPVAIPFERQDSAVLTALARADCLVVRPPEAPPARQGEIVEIVPLAGGVVST